MPGVPELRKSRIRPIFEPFLNALIPKAEIPQTHYPSRAERRAEMIGMKYAIDFDFTAFFDQFTIPQECQARFVFRGEGQELFALTRLPMGATFSPAIAQNTTWILTEGLASEKVRISTMIDNVRVVAKDATSFVSAIRTFLQRCRDAGVTLNEDPHPWTQLKDMDLVKIGARNISHGFDFLGEHFEGGAYQNTTHLVHKLNTAWTRLSPTSSRRDVASVVGLAIFMAHTLNIALRDHFSLFRWYSRLFKQTTILQWDEPIGALWTPGVELDLQRLCIPLVKNRPVSIRTVVAPALDNAAYDAVIIVDACAEGWGAHVRLHDVTYCVQQRFARLQPHSAHAEPMAVKAILAWTKAQKARRLAVVTDHIALVQGQRQWWSGYNGFSLAYPLNAAYQEAYADAETEFFYVEGEKNPADHPSRSTQATTITVTPSNIVFPQVSEYHHPFLSRPPHGW